MNMIYTLESYHKHLVGIYFFPLLLLQLSYKLKLAGFCGLCRIIHQLDQSRDKSVMKCAHTITHFMLNIKLVSVVILDTS